ncbi:MAG: ATP-grasp domain-containing protein [Chloroflexi bacterium]|nr:ATP-grasp domain-containing protein [Chloroflexota bacterium]
MFHKVLIANRGEIAVRIIKACRELEIETVALFTASDQTSLHVRLAHECVRLDSHTDFMNSELIAEIAQFKGADAVHPGIGFLSENTDFVRVCEDAGLTCIGPPLDILEATQNKLAMLDAARQAGIPTVTSSTQLFGEGDFDALKATARELGYPIILKSSRGGRGTAQRLVLGEEQLAEAVRQVYAEALRVYGDNRLYIERAIPKARQIGVQILGDADGNIIHLGEREGSLTWSNRKIIDETPATGLPSKQCEQLWETALQLSRMVGYQNVGTVEFLVDADGQFYFTEFKARLQTDHPITELVSGIDIVQHQLRLASGELLSLQQSEIHLNGHAIMARINAEDPNRHFLPSPGQFHQVRPPIGPFVRLDTYIHSNCNVPGDYSRLVAKLSTWAPDRPGCIKRLKQALEEFVLSGRPQTNVPLIQNVLETQAFLEGAYDTGFSIHALQAGQFPETYVRDLAIAAAIYYVRRNQMFDPSIPERLMSGWHRDSRRLPE